MDKLWILLSWIACTGGSRLANMFLFRPIIYVIAGLLIYAGVFLSEDQEKRVQDRLETIWLSIDDSSFSQVINTFVAAVAKLITSGTNRLFGKSLFSLRAVGVATLLSISSVSVWQTLSVLYADRLYHMTITPEVKSLAIGAAAEWVIPWMILVAISLSVRDRHIWLWFLVTVGLVALNIAHYSSDKSTCEKCGAPLQVLTVIAVLSSLVVSCWFLSVFRTNISKLSDSRSLWTAVWIVTLNIGYCLALIILPFWLGSLIFTNHTASHNAAIFAVFGSFPPLAMGILIFPFSLLVLALRMIRPVVKPVIYFLQRHRVFVEHKGLLAVAGVLLLGMASPTIGHRCLEVIEHFIR